MDATFERRGPSEIVSEQGQLRIRRVGLSVTYLGQRYELDSEMLEPPMSIAVYFRTSAASGADNAELIRAFISNALAFRGFTVQFL
jgi:hypothetical protein